MGSVVINEFEVVAEPVPGADDHREAAPKTAQQEGPTPADIERIVRRLRERQLRVTVY